MPSRHFVFFVCGLLGAKRRPYKLPCHILVLLSFVLELMFVTRHSLSFCCIFLNRLKEEVSNYNSYFWSTDLRGPVRDIWVWSSKEFMNRQSSKIMYISSVVLINFGRLSGLIFPDIWKTIYMLVFLLCQGPCRNYLELVYKKGFSVDHVSLQQRPVEKDRYEKHWRVTREENVTEVQNICLVIEGYSDIIGHHLKCKCSF